MRWRRNLRLVSGYQRNGLTTKKKHSCELLAGRKFRLHRAPRGCAEDEGGPLGVGLQELISNHLKLLWSKAMVVSV